MGRPKAAPTLFEIWQAGGKIASIESPVRLKILRHLEQAPRTLNELVVATRKSKPTLSSLHIPPLLQTGLIQERPDPHDGRVKWYKLVGTRLGSSAVDAADLRDAVLGYVESRGFMPLHPLLEILRPEELVKVAPEYADRVATRLGELLGRMLLQKDKNRAANELAKVLESAGLGTVKWVGTSLDVTTPNAALHRFVTRAAEAALGLQEHEITI
ncbi:MAG TPA: winged helix-turn-helix domain-containing protein [Candidatus Thermoplasmatota archaeon]